MTKIKKYLVKIVNWVKDLFYPNRSIAIETEVIRLNQLNKNGRIYKLENIDIDELNNRYVVGQIGFPENLDVSLKNASHVCSEFKVEGDSVFAKIETLKSPQGQLLKSILNDVVFRPRSIGTVNEDSTLNIQKIYSFDAISKSEDAFVSTTSHKYL